MILPKNAAQTAIAWAATNKSTCTVATRLITQPLHSLQTLAANSGVTVTRQSNELHFTYDPSRDSRPNL
jgi:hypothetical protein